MRNALKGLVTLTLAGVLGGTALADTIELRATGIVSTHKHHVGLERGFYQTLGEKTGLEIRVNFNPLDVVGVNMKDTLRLARSGTFDITQSTLGPVARDDPFLEGIDLIGVAPTIEELREVVEAYREPLQKRMAERFNVRVMTLWPFGPQVFYCTGKDIDSVADLKGRKVRVYTASMAALVESLGATPVTLQFVEVYPALQRGVADCAITSNTSGNTANWPEVTDVLLPLNISWAVNAHWFNLDKWNGLGSEQQKKLDAAFEDLDAEYWDMARELTGDALNCNTGRGPCKAYKKFDLRLVELSQADRQALKTAVGAVILPDWKARCNKVYPECTKEWNETVGAARGYTIE